MTDKELSLFVLRQLLVVNQIQTDSLSKFMADHPELTDDQRLFIGAQLAKVRGSNMRIIAAVSDVEAAPDGLVA